MDPLEAHRLLKGKADPQVGSFCDGLLCNILAVKQDLPGAGLLDPHDHLSQGRFSAAVGPRDHNKFIFTDRQADIL